PPSTPVAVPKEWSLPTVQQLAHAAYLPVTCEDGSQVSFGSLFEKTRTIVVFIRHFWCPLCQDYMASLKSIVKPEMLFAWPADGDDGEGDLTSRLVSFVVIGNGAPGMIQKYRQMFGLPFKVYTDPSLAIYQALGMERDGHPHVESGSYVKHGVMSGIAMVVGRAIKVGMPVWERGGDVDQLGGEFIFGPGLKCSFAHRMLSPRGHAPIGDVLTAAGID
ncbi:AhpC/TSA antioxidant enzyme-domain-containing protein, partial [Gymnopilus junonius]